MRNAWRLSEILIIKDLVTIQDAEIHGLQVVVQQVLHERLDQKRNLRGRLRPAVLRQRSESLRDEVFAWRSLFDVSEVFEREEDSKNRTLHHVSSGCQFSEREFPVGFERFEHAQGAFDRANVIVSRHGCKFPRSAILAVYTAILS